MCGRGVEGVQPQVREKGYGKQAVEMRAVGEARELAKVLLQRRGTEPVPAAEWEGVERVEQSGAQDLTARQR